MKFKLAFFTLAFVPIYFTQSGCKKNDEERRPITPALSFYLEELNGSKSLWYSTTSGESVTKVPTNELGDIATDPVWSSDGRTIFYTVNSIQKGINGVYSIKPNGSDPKTVYKDSDTLSRSYYQLASSKDNNNIVFSLKIPRSNRTVIELYKMCPCGESVKRLTSFETLGTTLTSTESYAGSFANDDSTLYFIQSDPLKTGLKDVNIYKINVGTGVNSLVKTIKARDVIGCTPDISPDGKEILLSIDGNIHIVNSDGTGLKMLGSLKGYHPKWDKDGISFYFSTHLIQGLQDGIYKSNKNFTSVERISTSSARGIFGGLGINK